MNNKKYYAGIGSRNTPRWVLDCMKNLGYCLSDDFILRSGGADGADSYFEIGCDKGSGEKEIFLPWRGFNNNDSKLYNISTDALNIAEKYHPAWNRLSQGAKKLMARNSYQVLGYDLNTPSSFIVCYTKNGKLTGGTAQALKIAKDYNIPIFNFGNYKDKEEALVGWNKFMNENKDIFNIE